MEQIGAWLQHIAWQDLLAAGGRVFLILVLAWALLAVSRAATRRLEQRMLRIAEHQGAHAPEAMKRSTTLAKLVRQGVVILIWAMALLMVLQEIGVSVGPLLASAGIAGLAVGFGAQNLVRDVISGFFLILENQVRVGDVAIVNGTSGAVEEINFRTLVLRDLSGVVHIFPNGSITSLSNMTKEWSAYVFDVGVSYKEDTDRVVGLIRDVARRLREDPDFGGVLLDDAEVFGVDRFGESAVLIKGRLRTRAGKQWETGREFLRRLKLRFDAEGIEIPFPHRAVYLADDARATLARGAADRGNAKSDGETAPR